MYSPSLLDLYRKLSNCLSNYISKFIIPNILDEESLELLCDEIVNGEDFELSETKMETYESKEELKHPQEYHSDQPIVIKLDDLNEKEKNDPRVHAMFKGSRQSNLSIFIIRPKITSFEKKQSVLIVLYII